MYKNLDSLSCGELVKLIISDVKEACAVLLGRYPDLVIKICVKRIGDREKAEDVVQQTYFKALGALQYFVPRAGEKSFKKWLSVIAIREVYSYFRAERKDRKIKEIAKEKFYIENSEDDQSCLTNDERAAFDAAVERLPGMTKNCFKARMNGRSIDEICETYNLTRRQCYGYIHRAKSILSEKMKKILEQHNGQI